MSSTTLWTQSNMSWTTLWDIKIDIQTWVQLHFELNQTWVELHFELNQTWVELHFELNQTWVELHFEIQNKPS